MTVAIRCSDRLGDAVLAIRRAVFIDEQGIPEADELDGTDDGCTHWLLSEDGLPVATLRSKVTGGVLKIGRVATLPQARGRGHAARLVARAMDQAREAGMLRATLSAQEGAMDWYRRFGFSPEGRAYDDAGIPHRTMWAPL